MKYIGRFLRFWYDFIVGDDGRLAVGTIALLVVTDAAVTWYADGWLVLPLAVLALLAASVRIAARVARTT